MNVFLRLLKVIGIGALLFLHENQDQLFSNSLISNHFISGLIGFFLFFLIAETVKDLLFYFYRKRKRMAPKATDNVTVGLDNIYILLMAGALFYLILHFLNLRPKDFFTGITLISAAIAIIMKDYVSNIISGMIIAFSDKLKIGDYVQVGQSKGEIVDFSLTSITLRNDDDELIYLPINVIFTHELVNFTSGGLDSSTVEFELNNKMKVPYEALQTCIDDAIRPYLHLMIKDSLRLIVTASKQESTVFKYKYTLELRDIALDRKIHSTILKAVYDNTSMIKSTS